MLHVQKICLSQKTCFLSWPGLSVLVTPPQMLCSEFAPSALSTHFLTSQSAFVSVIGRTPRERNLLSQRKRRLNMFCKACVRTATFIRTLASNLASQSAFQLTIQTSESQDKGRLCPHLPATPCPAPAPHLTPWHPVAPPLPPSLPLSPSLQNSTAGPLWK